MLSQHSPQMLTASSTALLRQLPATIMLVRALRRGGALPLRQRAIVPLARRTVTTDAASSHAEKEHVPEARILSPVKLESPTNHHGGL